MYLGIILLTTVVVPGVPLLMDRTVPDLWFADSALQIVIGFVMIVCALAAAVARRRFAAVLLVGASATGWPRCS